MRKVKLGARALVKWSTDFETRIPSEMKVRNKIQIDKINRTRKII